MNNNDNKSFVMYWVLMIYQALFISSETSQQPYEVDTTINSIWQETEVLRLSNLLHPVHRSIIHRVTILEGRDGPSEPPAFCSYSSQEL